MFDLSLLEYGPTRNLLRICDQQAPLEESNRYHWTIVGEWTGKSESTSASREPKLTDSNE
jgi:hypothetical protein